MCQALLREFAGLFYKSSKRPLDKSPEVGTIQYRQLFVHLRFTQKLVARILLMATKARWGQCPGNSITPHNLRAVADVISNIIPPAAGIVYAMLQVRMVRG